MRDKGYYSNQRRIELQSIPKQKGRMLGKYFYHLIGMTIAVSLIFAIYKTRESIQELFVTIAFLLVAISGCWILLTNCGEDFLYDYDYQGKRIISKSRSDKIMLNSVYVASGVSATLMIGTVWGAISITKF